MFMASSMESWTVWRLRRGMDRRFRAGHPWVYSNELAESPKGIEPGAWVELQDAGGKFLARGYGNPQSLISFRAVSRNPEERSPLEVDNMIKILQRAGQLRSRVGLGDVSHRLCFGEADGLPGLVIDRYLTESGQVFVVQAHTAGADRLLPHIEAILELYVKSTPGAPKWSQTSIVLRNDLSVRKLEGLLEEEPRILKEVTGLKLQDSTILIHPVLGGKPIPFQVDLLRGQKTGFFLDQFANIQIAALRLKQGLNHFSSTRVRILDLCSYVGQWGTQFSRLFKDLGIQVEVTALDASAQALEFARRNVEAQGAKCVTWKADVLKSLVEVEDHSFDIVISDPPALIKNRKDIPAGTHAYLQLASQVFRIVKKGGGVVCCSCSALLAEESFTQVLAKAAARNRVQVKWVGHGAQSPDHPMLVEFPEGRYLKAWVGFADSVQ